MDLFPEFENNIEKEWHGMPEFIQNDLNPVKQIVVSFDSKEEYEKFSKLIEQPLTIKTQSVWWPRAEIDRMMNQRYKTKTQIK